MARHFKWHEYHTCEECPLRDECDADDMAKECPLIVRDGISLIDWKANGWPEPNPYGEGDTSNMPYSVWQIWESKCGQLEYGFYEWSPE